MNRPAKVIALLVLRVALAEAQGTLDTLDLTGADPDELPFTLASEEELQSELERLSAMMDDPVDLRRSSESELMLVPGFDRTLARLVLDSASARRVRGLADLGRIPALSRRALRAAAPFVSAAGHEKAEATRLLSGSLRMRAEALVSQTPADGLAVLGSRLKTFCCLRLEHAGEPGTPLVKAALLAEKDAGEIRFSDHAAGFLWLSPGGGFELTAGDFAVGGALGLAFGAGGTRLSREARSQSWKSLVARPTASASESVGLRGVLAVYRSHGCEAALFYSNRAVHARLDDSSVVTSFYTAGLFRTASELALRSRTRERALGARLSVQIAQNLRLGASASHCFFLHPIRAACAIEGASRRFAVAGIDALCVIGRSELALELARDGRGMSAFAAGLDVRMSPTLHGRAALRCVDSGFAGLHGPALESPGEVSAASLGIRWELVPSVRWELRGDQHRAVRAGPAELAITERSVESRLEADPSDELSVTLLVRAHVAEEAVTALDEFGRTVRRMGQGRAHSARFVLEFEPSAGVRLKCGVDVRAVGTASSAKTDWGYCLLHELCWQVAPWAELKVRALSYATDSYAARVYDWDQSVSGTITQTLLYGSGFRTSAYVRLRLSKAVTCELHFSETDRMLEREIGGRTLPERYERRTLSAQLEARF